LCFTAYSLNNALAPRLSASLKTGTLKFKKISEQKKERKKITSKGGQANIERENLQLCVLTLPKNPFFFWGRPGGGASLKARPPGAYF